MSPREIRERLTALASRLIDFQNPFDKRRNFAERNSREDLLRDRLRVAIAAAEHDVVTLDRRAANVHFHALQADVAHIMLRTRIRTTGEMDVDGLVEADALVEMFAERDGL